MDQYIQIDIKTNNKEHNDMLVALLSAEGFEFEEEKGRLKAYIRQDLADLDNLNNLLSNKDLTYSLSIIKNKNWNQEWELGFEPVRVEDYCCIRASFHAPVSGVEHEIIITPRMSFGTGHHATTYMMIQAMRELNFKNKSILDFGTGTGVLAILSWQSGAGKIVAIDNDDWSIENAAANFKENQAEKILLQKADSIPSGELFDIILANINRNIILAHLSTIKQHLLPGGVVLFSGLLKDDKEMILEAFKSEGLYLQKSLERDSWICLKAGII